MNKTNTPREFRRKDETTLKKMRTGELRQLVISTMSGWVEENLAPRLDRLEAEIAYLKDQAIRWDLPASSPIAEIGEVVDPG